MSIVMKCAIVGGFVLYWQIRRPEVYLKRSRRARIGFTITKYAIVAGMLALILYFERFLISML